MPTGDHIRTTGSAVTIVTGVVAAIVFFVRLDGRVTRLEEQVHTLTLAPVLSSTGKDGEAIAPRATPNPMAQACADLAKRSADEISRGFEMSADRIQKTMSDMGCTRSP